MDGIIRSCGFRGLASVTFGDSLYDLRAKSKVRAGGRSVLIRPDQFNFLFHGLILPKYESVGRQKKKKKV